MVSPYIERESNIIKLAEAIKDATSPQEAIAAARAVGISDEITEMYLDDAQQRVFQWQMRALQYARAM